MEATLYRHLLLLTNQRRRRRCLAKTRIKSECTDSGSIAPWKQRHWLRPLAHHAVLRAVNPNFPGLNRSLLQVTFTHVRFIWIKSRPVGWPLANVCISGSTATCGALSSRCTSCCSRWASGHQWWAGWGPRTTRCPGLPGWVASPPRFPCGPNRSGQPRSSPGRRSRAAWWWSSGPCTCTGTRENAEASKQGRTPQQL